MGKKDITKWNSAQLTAAILRSKLNTSKSSNPLKSDSHLLNRPTFGNRRQRHRLRRIEQRTVCRDKCGDFGVTTHLFPVISGGGDLQRF